MASVRDRRVVQAGHTIFREGEPGHNMFIVEKGRVMIWRGSPDNRIILGFIPAGGIFGEMAIFDDGMRMASASAVAETVLVAVHADRVREAMRKADPILEKLIRVMLESTRSLAKQVEDLSAKSPSEDDGPAEG